ELEDDGEGDDPFDHGMFGDANQFYGVNPQHHTGNSSSIYGGPVHYGSFDPRGVTEPSGITTRSNPFGSLFAFNDPLNETPDPSSKVVGHTEGFSVKSSFDGEHNVGVSRITLNLKGYKGELLNAGTAHYTKVSELPFIGGTGDF
uniref:Dirigent protein n=1 Tax=Chenopodium quinoa TaxID=63459 RepID=A0A803MGZ9_CHEQI